MRSGSKKRPGAAKPKADTPAELADWQIAAIDAVARSSLAREVVFGGGAALSVLHLHHRRSEDLDFFLTRELEPAELRPLIRSLRRDGTSIEQVQVGPRQSLLLLRDAEEFGRIDFAFYPYDAISPRERWRGLQVESLLDMTVNKVQAALTRFQPRDLVDLYFLLREGPERDLDRLLGFARAKFDTGADRLALAERLLQASSIRELPHMLRSVTVPDLVQYFEEQARALARLA